VSLGGFQDRYGDFYAPRFRLTVGGEAFTEASGVVADLSVDTTLEGADRFSVSLAYEYDPEFEGGTFLGLEWETFAPGTDVTIEVGYEDRSLLVPVLVGRIASVGTDFPSGGLPTVTVSGYDLLHDLTQATNSDSWDETTDAAVVKRVLQRGAYGFDAPTSETVVETGTEHPQVRQDDETDFAFLTTLAERNGFELFARGRTLHFRPPAVEADPTMTLAYGASLGSFAPELNAAERVTEVEVRHWHPERGEVIVGTATDDTAEEASDGGAGGNKRVLRLPVRSTEEAETEAAAALARLSRGVISGSGDTVGLPDLRVGEPIRIEGVTDRFTADYYVTSVTHRLGGSGYGTSFTATEVIT
jgi:hypothetical protein